MLSLIDVNKLYSRTQDGSDTFFRIVCIVSLIGIYSNTYCDAP